MMLFTTKFFYDHLGKTYTKDVTNRMAKDKETYIKEVVDEYNKFKKNITNYLNVRKIVIVEIK